MWVELYDNVKQYLAEAKQDAWIISSIENSREMKTTYTGPRELIAMIKFISFKASEERAISSGDICQEGGLFFSVAGGDG